MVTRRTLLKGLAAGALVYPALPWRWLVASEQPASGDIAFLSASRLSDLIHRRAISALELLDLSDHGARSQVFKLAARRLKSLPDQMGCGQRANSYSIRTIRPRQYGFGPSGSNQATSPSSGISISSRHW